MPVVMLGARDRRKHMKTRVWLPSKLPRGGGPGAESPWTEQLTGQDVWILWWEELRQPKRFAAAVSPCAPRPGGSATPETAPPRQEGPEEQKPEASHHGEVARPPLPPRGCPGARLPSAGSPLRGSQAHTWRGVHGEPGDCLHRPGGASSQAQGPERVWSSPGAPRAS